MGDRVLMEVHHRHHDPHHETAYVRRRNAGGGVVLSHDMQSQYKRSYRGDGSPVRPEMVTNRFIVGLDYRVPAR